MAHLWGPPYLRSLLILLCKT